MKIFFILLFIASVFAALHPVNKQIVNEIKAKADTWTPIEPEENPFAYMSIEQIKGMMGYKKRINIITSQAKHAPVPDTFDSRTHWKGSAQKIRDQQQWGSCWAFGATGALSDRFYIASNGKVDVELSPQYLVSWDQSNFGCNGGYLQIFYINFEI